MRLQNFEVIISYPKTVIIIEGNRKLLISRNKYRLKKLICPRRSKGYKSFSNLIRSRKAFLIVNTLRPLLPEIIQRL